MSAEEGHRASQRLEQPSDVGRRGRQAGALGDGLSRRVEAAGPRREARAAPSSRARSSDGSRCASGLPALPDRDREAESDRAPSPLVKRIPPGATAEQMQAISKQANWLVNEARKPGADFCALVAQYSDDAQTKKTCSLRGPQPQAALLPELQTAVAGLKVGEVTEPVHAGTGEAVVIGQVGPCPDADVRHEGSDVGAGVRRGDGAPAEARARRVTAQRLRRTPPLGGRRLSRDPGAIAASGSLEIQEYLSLALLALAWAHARYACLLLRERWGGSDEGEAAEGQGQRGSVDGGRRVLRVGVSWRGRRWGRGCRLWSRR